MTKRTPKSVAVLVAEPVASRAFKPTTGNGEIEAPSQRYLEALRTQMETLYAEQDMQIQRSRDVRDTKRMVNLPDEFRIVDVEVRDSTISDEIQRVAAMLSIRPPTLSVTPVRESDAGQRNATLREHWTEACLHYAGGRRPGLTTFESVTDAVVGDGGGWSKFVFSNDIWSERFALTVDQYEDDEEIARGSGQTKEAKFIEATEDAKKEAGPPFTWRAVDAKSVYPVFTGDRISEVIEVSERPEITTFRQYRLARDKGGNIVYPEELGDQQPVHTTTSIGTVEFVEHWDDIWCFPASTLVSVDSSISKVYRRWYVGDLVEIVTAAGRKLSGTPNHPVLTARGWVALGKLIVGDDVISHDLGHNIPSVHPDKEDMYTPIHEMFDFASNVGNCKRRSSVVTDFHGDGQESDIDVVVVDRLLMDRFKASRREPLAEQDFTLADVVHPALVGSGNDRLNTGTLTATANRTVSLEGNSLSFLREHSFVTDAGGFLSRTDSNSVAQQVMRDCNGASASHFPDDSRGEEAFRVEFDRINTVRRVPFSGHVFNLETDSHYYSASGIIAHNCTYMVCGRTAAGAETGKIVAQWRHGYSRHPYFWAPGLMRSYWSNHKVGWGVSESKRWLVEYRSFLWTLVANVAARDAMPPIQRKLAPDNIAQSGESGEPRASEKWDPRAILNLKPGEELVPLQFPPIAQSIMELIKIVDDAISKLEAPRVNSEIGGGMEGAGFAINQILAEARVRFNPLANSIERMLEELTRFMWHLVRTKIGEDVWVFSQKEGGGFIKAGPKDLTNGVMIAWKIDPEMPSAKLIEGRYWDEQVKAGFASKDQAIKEQGRNPDEVREGIAMDRMRTTPWYQAAQDKLVLDALGMGDQGQKVGTPIAPMGTPGGPAPIPSPMGGASGSAPDMGQLAMGPGGPPPPMQGPPPGGIPGSSPGVVVPNGSAAPGALALVGR